MVVCAFLDSISIGSNDVGNAISPMLVIMKIEGWETFWGFLLGSIGIALGLLILGKRVMITVGENIIQLDFMKGFCCSFASASVIMLGSTFGIPLSTTHCAIGALGGIFVAGKFKWMKAVYESNTTSEKYSTTPSVKGEESKMNMQTAKKILLWWGITVPFSLTVNYLVTLIFMQTI